VRAAAVASAVVYSEQLANVYAAWREKPGTRCWKLLEDSTVPGVGFRETTCSEGDITCVFGLVDFGFP
jgi:hypothetical protein